MRACWLHKTWLLPPYGWCMKWRPEYHLIYAKDIHFIGSYKWGDIRTEDGYQAVLCCKNAQAPPKSDDFPIKPSFAEDFPLPFNLVSIWTMGPKTDIFHHGEQLRSATPDGKVVFHWYSLATALQLIATTQFCLLFKTKSTNWGQISKDWLQCAGQNHSLDVVEQVEAAYNFSMSFFSDICNLAMFVSY